MGHWTDRPGHFHLFLTFNFSALPFLSNLSPLPLPTISDHFLSIYLYDINTFMLFTVCFFMAMAVTTNFLSKSSNFNFDNNTKKCIAQCQLISICHSMHLILQTLLFTILESREHNCPKSDPVAPLNVFTVKATCISFGMSTVHPIVIQDLVLSNEINLYYSTPAPNSEQIINRASVTLALMVLDLTLSKSENTMLSSELSVYLCV